jgi:hypothetical protein
MKTTIFVLTLLFFLSSFVFAQGGPPPPAAPDYAPKMWKEYSFADDNVRFKFPVQPKREETTSGSEKHPARVYSRQSFMFFQLSVVSWPIDTDIESTGNALKGAREGGLAKIKHLEPKILEEKDIQVDGHAAKFLKFETNDGLITRMKVFVVKNRIYVAVVMVEKGKKHGFNSENDFEIPAMGFLDSIRLINS